MNFFCSPIKTSPIQLYNRETDSLEEEILFEKKFMAFFYGTTFGRCMTRLFLSQKPFSIMYGWKQNRPKSKDRIRPFVKKYCIRTNELVKSLDAYQTFNEFFTRKLKSSARPIDKGSDTLISPADARLLVSSLCRNQVLPIKGCPFTLGALLGNSRKEKIWQGGICLKFRLSPADYHRFCYIDNGVHGPVVHVDGNLHSVSPLALRQRLKILDGNDREYVVMQTDNFGLVAHIDIGAMVVGKIYQHFRQGGTVVKGAEKGYFEFGGSTILLFFEPGRIQMDQDILKYSCMGIETLVRYGEAIGTKICHS